LRVGGGGNRTKTATTRGLDAERFAGLQLDGATTRQLLAAPIDPL
jgi:hypothetical protein